ncbi:hypothetical protein LIER_09856 [Lithospermum erythrorhizon]|uniref:Uncharacterized protein n=1 Tax=Lithospermum erythrorhizon TaxID=34254 RepID=A0AAV3PH55_LITER
MEGGEVAGADTKRRARKRKNVEVRNVMSDRDGKRRVLATRSMVYVGRYVKKEFEGNGVFLGKIVYYDSGLYRVDYEDGDFEDLESNEAKELLIEESDLEGKWVERRKQLDELVSNKYGKEKGIAVDRNVELGNAVDDKVEVPPVSVEKSTDGSNCNRVEGPQSDGDCRGDAGSSSELSEDEQELEPMSEIVEVPLVPPPELPSSSGNIGIPEEYVSHLLSVYSFLRSFSIQLYLSPFGLDDFVGSLNCTLPNTLLESVHVALLRTLRDHLENCSTDGSELASKCLRFLDWTLLDTLTWPVYLVHYLKVMGYTNGPQWKDMCYHAMEKNYFTLLAGWKLLALQILCDDVLDSEAVRSQIDVLEESEVGIESDAVMATIPSSEPRRVHPRYTKTSACKDQEAMRMIGGSQETSKVGGQDAGSDEDGNSDECNLCGMDGMLLCCDGCPSSYHSRCIGVSKLSISEGDWFCPECTMNKTGPIFTRETSLKGAKVFGIDLYEQVFVGTCNYLLVLNGSINSNICLRYYSQDDIPRLLEALHSNIYHISLYKEICKGIMSCWEIPESVLYSICSTPETGIPDQVCRTGVQSDQLGVNSDTDLLKKSSETSFNTAVLEQTPIQSAANQQADQFNSTIQNNYKVVKEAVSGRRVKPTADIHLLMGSSFKVQGYNNNYLHGDFAASAAASLDALTPDNVRVSSSNSIGSKRKVMSANYALQAKAFSSAAIRFFWPHTEKKLIEGPRERCSWCLACKAPVSSRRGCLLNAAAIMATKGAIKVLATLGPPKNVEGSIPSIATYIIFMEESLSGLTEGPFQSSLFRKQWRKQLEKATSCSVIKALLLQLEENIRTVAVSGDWVKLVDGWSAESSVVQCKALNAVSSTQKRRPGRRGRKASVVTEVVDDDSQDTLADITWWRGGHLLTFISQKGTLPHLSVKKAARQGGSRRISGVYYTEGVETAKRNRQLVWRAAVDMCKNVAQLALQVRYLDLHVKWADLVRPEQSAQETKGPETESSVFRNAFICDKKIANSEIRYCVAFGSQKHLPSKVIKNILETEQTEDGEEKYWFSEFRIPLYLIKEFEVTATKKASQTSEKSQLLLSKLPRKQLKASHMNIFFYLERKRDNNEKVPCDSCRLGVSLGNAVQCNACQGLCHESCTVSSTVQTSEEVQYMSTCKDCYQAKVQSELQKNESPTSPLLFQGQVFSSAERPFSSNQGSASTGILEKYANAKPTKETRPASLSKLKRNWGLVWRKKKGEEHIGDDFIIRNILLKGNPHMHSLKPKCHLCDRPYSPDLMYIHCEACNNWFHADAVGLQEEKIFDLVGFKCCKCRRIRLPTCPYSALSEVKRLRVKGPKLENMAIRPIHGSMEEQQDFLIRSEGISHFAHDDPLLISSSEVHPQMYYECNIATVSAPQKLPVRRSAKREKDDLFTADGSGYAASSTSFDGKIGDSVEELALPLVEWDVSANGFDDNMMFDFDCLDNVDADFEPQTYFSFNELLAADDGGLLQGMEPSADATENWEMSNAIQRNDHPASLDNQPGGPPISVCFICSDRDPPPDHFCQTCGAWIHINCSPWVEPPSVDGGWRCGNCRGWP